MNTTSPNPLLKHFRQPKVYIRLPSNGEYYNGAIEKTETGEYPVLGMTARDELMYKTPDALLNGQATVDVIQSCVPNIKNAWSIPVIDLDVILIGIRIASMGEKMDINFTVPGLNEERSYDVNLVTLLDQLYSQTYDNIVHVNDFTVELKPVSYKTFNDMSLKTFEEQRIFNLLKDNSISETLKLEKIQQSFSNLTNLNIALIKDSIMSVRYMDEPAVTQRTHINEFIDQCEKEVYSEIVKHIETQKKKFALKPLKVEFSKEDQEKGAPPLIEIPMRLDQASFFGKGS